MPTAVIALGSNLGHRQENIERALAKMREQGLVVDKVSSFIETEPYGYLEQNKFLNGVCLCQTELNPLALLDLLLGIEKEMGRTREIRWGPRLIDLDIIFYGNQIIREAKLTIPHPDAHNRLFVLAPLLEIAPAFVHPVYGKTIAELHEGLLLQ